MRTAASYLRIISFIVLSYFLLNYFGTTGDQSIFIEKPILWAILAFLGLIYCAGEILLGTLQAILFKTLSSEQQESYLAKEAIAKEKRYGWIKKTYNKLAGTKPIEEEHEIILDHNYDGIQELDNVLPPWWVYGFYLTIIVAVVYYARFHIFEGENQIQEYQEEVKQAELAIAEYKKTAKDLVDASTVELLTDASDINAGKTIFLGNCIACHKADGGGGIGPNLTDQHWILGGGIKNVFNTISEGGRDGKGMVSWKSDLKPSEIAQVASFVLSLQGTSPAEPKEPQGDIWEDENAAEETNQSTIDSTAIEVIIEDKIAEARPGIDK